VIKKAGLEHSGILPSQGVFKVGGKKEKNSYLFLIKLKIENYFLWFKDYVK
jgi:hypothetical protein